MSFGLSADDLLALERYDAFGLCAGNFFFLAVLESANERKTHFLGRAALFNVVPRSALDRHLGAVRVAKSSDDNDFRAMKALPELSAAPPTRFRPASAHPERPRRCLRGRQVQPFRNVQAQVGVCPMRLTIRESA